MQESVDMRKLRKGWKQFDEDDYWWVVHEQRRQWLPRYHSEPTLVPSQKTLVALP